MTIDPRFAAEVVDTCAAATILLGVLIVATRSIGRTIWMVALQSALVGLAAVAVGLGTGVGQLAMGGLLAIAVKTIVVPLVLGSILRRSSVRQERHPLLGPRLALVAAVAIVFAATLAADGVTPGAGMAASRALPAAISQVLTGLLVVMTRRKALSLVVGLLVFENGIALAAFAFTYGMPLVVELGILFDLLIAVVVAWVYARRMLDVFGSLSTDELRSLRGCTNSSSRSSWPRRLSPGWWPGSPTRGGRPGSGWRASAHRSLPGSRSRASSSSTAPSGPSVASWSSIAFHCFLNLSSLSPLAMPTETEWSVKATYS